jgi:hypothetical protein
MTATPNQPAGDEREAIALIAPGHWDTSEGHEMAVEYAARDRASLMMGDLSDFALANAQFMADRNSIDLIAFQTAAKQRIRWLSVQLAAALSPDRGQAEAWPTFESAPKDGRYILAVVAPDRGRHLEHHAGRVFAIRHEGQTPSGYDLGWAVYPGFGGASDHDFTKWCPIPAFPATPSDRGQAMSTPATKIVEDCFAEDILKQSTRLKVFPDEGESPGTWQQRVRKAAILAALADQPAMSTHDETCWLIEKCAKIADKRRVEERAKGNLSKGHVAEEIASDIRALATPFTPDDVGRAAEVERLTHVIDRDRYVAAIGLEAIRKAIGGHAWLLEGRGPYAWDDDRYRQEFGDAMRNIEAALEPLAQLASDKSDCTRDSIKVQEARDAARQFLASRATPSTPGVREALEGGGVGREYRKTATITAVQWWKMGDHPAVVMTDDVSPAIEAGHAIPWIRTLEGGHIVTPGDWIATGAKGEHWPIKADIFALTYEPVATSAPTGERTWPECLDGNASHNRRARATHSERT